MKGLRKPDPSLSTSDSMQPRPTTTHRRLVAGVGLAAVVCVLSVVGFSIIHKKANNADLRIQVGRKLPALVVTNTAGASVDLSQESFGHRRVIAFYSPECHVCQATLPELAPLPKDITLIMVSERDRSTLPASELSELPGKVFFDSNHVLGAAESIVSLPTILFVDGAGVVDDVALGDHDRASIQRKLATLISTGS